MKKNNLVSIIMNCYNGEKYLSESVKSIIDQTYKNWELIFWDNLSKDNSKKILLSFKDNRIKYFRGSKHVNLYKARNLAINKAKGKYLCFLDTDDTWEKFKLKKQLKKIKNTNDLVFSNYYFLKNEKKKIAINNKKNQSFSTQNLLDNYCIGLLTVMVDVVFFKKNKLKFNGKYNIIGDFDFFIKLSKKINFNYISEPLATYRYHDNNFSKKNSSLIVKERNLWTKENKKYFKNYDLNKFLSETSYLKIKIYAFKNELIKFFTEFFKLPFNLKKIRLLILVFSPKKYFSF